MISNLQVSILSTLAESILQGRLDVKRNVFTHFRTAIENLKTQPTSSSDNQLEKFMKQLLQKSTYGIRTKMNKKVQAFPNLRKVGLWIHFYLIEKKTGNKSDVESWNISYIKKEKIEANVFATVSDIFKEVILVLNKLPLFSIYHKDKQLKVKYTLDYSCVIDVNGKESFIRSVQDFGSKHIIHRENQCMKYEISILYMPCLSHFKQNGLLKGKEEESTRKGSLALSDFDGDRRISVYEFYDPDLDITFLSSDDEIFKKKGMEVESEVEMEREESGDFEMLMLNEDEEFVEENMELLVQLGEFAKHYV